MLQRDGGTQYLTQAFGQGFIVLGLNLSTTESQALHLLAGQTSTGIGLPTPAVIEARTEAHTGADAQCWLVMHAGLRNYASDTGAIYVLRPDGYVLGRWRSEEHTSELQSLMRISSAVFCLKKQTRKQTTNQCRQQHLTT